MSVYELYTVRRQRTIGMKESQSPLQCSSLRTHQMKRASLVRFSFDDKLIEAYAGETVAAALFAAGIRVLRQSPRAGTPRGTFCWMGLCQECIVVADGVRRPACRLEVQDGMVVQPGTVP
jgi:D-hydroxyproline dehydrogenase subunit gamma